MLKIKVIDVKKLKLKLREITIRLERIHHQTFISETKPKESKNAR